MVSSVMSPASLETRAARTGRAGHMEKAVREGRTKGRPKKAGISAGGAPAPTYFRCNCLSWLAAQSV